VREREAIESKLSELDVSAEGRRSNLRIGIPADLNSLLRKKTRPC
jgi:hypothetical protein